MISCTSLNESAYVHGNVDREDEIQVDHGFTNAEFKAHHNGHTGVAESQSKSISVGLN